MLDCSCVLVSYLLMMTLFHCSAESLRLTEERPESVLMEHHGDQLGADAQKGSGSVKNKLLFLNQLFHVENDVIETKRKRSFPGSSIPLDRLSISSMDPKSNKQRKVELPRRRVTIPIDRIGVGRLPNSRG
ncbi:osteocrin [Electrophorus electricus]|uniref:osteocrin n=1 Tax=Electrophorus electricus TaxID=8005 RepID=UPI0015D01E5D|nr:osteocrin [Electrophorus electricus]